jgi:hypothetical protein
MLRRIVAVIIVSAGLAAGSAVARSRHPVDATPFAHAPCSVLASEPCAPSVCSVFNHGPCIPEIDAPLGENLQLTVLSAPAQQDAGKYQKPDRDLDSIGDLFAALRACWSPPPADNARAGMQISVLFSFRRSGEIIAPPRLTFATRGVASAVRAGYLDAITASLRQCAPLAFSKGLGGAIAGRPIMVRYIDNRALPKPPDVN